MVYIPRVCFSLRLNCLLYLVVGDEDMSEIYDELTTLLQNGTAQCDVTVECTISCKLQTLTNVSILAFFKYFLPLNVINCVDFSSVSLL